MNVEERMNRAERRIETVEDAIQLLSKLIANHDDRLYDSLKSREDLDAKITMLIDAQIKSEDKLQNQSVELNTKISALFDAQIRSEDQIQNINKALDKLTGLVNKSHQRLDRLES